VSAPTSRAAPRIPAEVAAVIAAVIASALKRNPEGLLLTFQGPFPYGRPDAGSYHLAGRLQPSTPPRGGRA